MGVYMNACMFRCMYVCMYVCVFLHLCMYVIIIINIVIIFIIRYHNLFILTHCKIWQLDLRKSRLFFGIPYKELFLKLNLHVCMYVCINVCTIDHCKMLST